MTSACEDANDEAGVGHLAHLRVVDVEQDPAVELALDLPFLEGQVEQRILGVAAAQHVERQPQAERVA